MAKVKYTYDSKNLSYRRIDRTWKQRLQEVTIFSVAAMAFGLVFYLAADLWFESPKERKMKRELDNMVIQYELMDGKLGQLTDVLGDIEKRDDEIYRTIFEPRYVQRVLAELIVIKTWKALTTQSFLWTLAKS